MVLKLVNCCVSFLALGLLALSHAAGAAEPSQFCRDRLVHDYEKPLRALPKLRAIPEHPSFAPPNTSLYGPKRSVLVLSDGEAERVEYGFSAARDSDRRFSLHWTITGRADQVNAKGEVLRSVGQKERRVGVVDEAAFNRLFLALALPSDVGLYRVELVFRDRDRTVLGRYGQYFRIVRPRISVQLALSPPIVHPGQVMNTRLLNFGTATIRYGEPFRVEQFDGSRWVGYPLNINWHRPLFRLHGGQAGRCQALRIPEDMAPGAYRFRKPLADPSRGLTANFEVAP
jgi:hypothetical protein